MMCKFRFVAVLFLIAFAARAAEEKTPAQYWQEAGLSYSLIQDEIKNTKCYADLKTFIACVHGTNAMLGASTEKLMVLPTARVTGNADVTRVREDFGAVKLVERREIRGADFMATVRLLKQDRDRNHAAWTALHAQGNQPIDFDRLLTWVKDNVVGRVEESMLTGTGFNGWLGAYYDPHTRIEPKAQFEDRGRRSETSFFGIGVIIRAVESTIAIERPMPGSPAHRAGIRAKDVITHVDGRTIAGMTTEQLVRLVRGPNGTTVTLTLRRGMQTLEIAVVRGPIVQRNVEASLVTNETRKKVGVVKLGDFVQGQVDQEISDAIEGLKGQGAESLVLDLRNNGGGRLDYTVNILSLLLGPNRRVLEVRNLLLPSQIQPYRTQYEQLTDLPMVTLINAHSASASEIVSGVLQDLDRSLILGDRSFGKGTVQNIFAWPKAPQKIAYFSTTARYHLPSGRTPQIRGVSPDISAFDSPNPTEQDRFALREEDLYLNALPELGAEWRPSAARAEKVATMTRCMDTTGLARQRFQDGREDAIPPDYQLLMAQDALVCGN